MRATSSSRGTDRISSNHPSERPRLMPISAETATCARSSGRSTPCAFMLATRGPTRRRASAVQGGVADLGGGVGTDDGLKDRAGAALVGPGYHHVGYLFQPLVLAGGPVGILGSHRGDVEVGLAAEVAGDEGGVDPGPLTDLPDRRALEPLLAEEGLGRLEQGVLAGRGVPGSAGPVCSSWAPRRRVAHAHGRSSSGPAGSGSSPATRPAPPSSASSFISTSRSSSSPTVSALGGDGARPGSTKLTTAVARHRAAAMIRAALKPSTSGRA